jgi:hypothetical protein
VILKIWRFLIAPVTVGTCFWILNNPPMLPGVAGAASTAPDLRTLHIRLLETLLIGITLLALTLRPGSRPDAKQLNPKLRSSNPSHFLHRASSQEVPLRSKKKSGVLQRSSGNHPQPGVQDMRSPSAFAAAVLILLTVGAACLFVQNLNSPENKQITRSYDAR